MIEPQVPGRELGSRSSALWLVVCENERINPRIAARPVEPAAVSDIKLSAAPRNFVDREILKTFSGIRRAEAYLDG